MKLRAGDQDTLRPEDRAHRIDHLRLGDSTHDIRLNEARGICEILFHCKKRLSLIDVVITREGVVVAPS